MMKIVLKTMSCTYWVALLVFLSVSTSSIVVGAQQEQIEDTPSEVTSIDQASASTPKSDILTRRIDNIHLVDPQANDFHQQVIFLEFDGAEGVTYRGPIEIKDIDVSAFTVAGTALEGQETAIIEQILRDLNAVFDGTGVTFTIHRPQGYAVFSVHPGIPGKAARILRKK